MNEYSSVGFQALDMRCPGLNIRASYNLQTKNVDPYNRSFELLTQDLKKMKPIIKRLALYDWNTIGAEGHSSYSDSGISRTFVSRDDILSQVIPFATVLSAQ